MAGILAQRAIHRVDADWTAYGRELARDGTEALHDELTRVAQSLRASAESALEVSDDPRMAFRKLEGLGRGREERGIVLYSDASPVAWGGRVRVPTEALVRPSGISVTPFY